MQRSAYGNRRSSSLGRALAVFASLASAACGGDDSGSRPEIREGCNALGGEGCVLPWPSSVYEIDDVDSATGKRLNIPVDVLPLNTAGVRPPPEIWNASDGWSANIPLLMAWSTGFDPDSLVGPDAPERSLTDESPTAIVDLVTGERVAHFAEPDLQARDVMGATADQVALILRPVARLVPGRRYAVGIRDTLEAADGGELPVSHAFRALRDEEPQNDPALDAWVPRFEQIFEALGAAGVPREDLVVAWDFSVRSDEPVYRDLLAGRDAMLDAIGERTDLEIAIESDEPGDDPEQAMRVVVGTFELPSLLSDDGGSASVLHRDAGGNAAVNGTIHAPLGVVIPACAADPANLPLPVVIAGHGLLGTIQETTGEYYQQFAGRLCVAVVSTEWRGMSNADLPSVIIALRDLSSVDRVMEKLVQGVNQFVALETLVRGAWLDRPEFQVDGAPLFDPTRVYYYGSSQGGILGGTFMSIDPFIERGVLGVAAADFSYIIERSTNWNSFRETLYESYVSNALDAQVALTLFQMRWDLTDPITHVSHLTGDVEPTYPGVPGKQVLLQIARNDSQVANLGTDLFARTAGLSVLEPSIYVPYGLESAEGPLASGIAQWDEHFPPAPPGGNWTPTDNGTHGSLRWRDTAIEQIRGFFASGEITAACAVDGAPVACDCTNTADDVCGPPHE